MAKRRLTESRCAGASRAVLARSSPAATLDPCFYENSVVAATPGVGWKRYRRHLRARWKWLWTTRGRHFLSRVDTTRTRAADRLHARQACAAFVVMMEAAEVRDFDNRAGGRRLHRTGRGCVLREAR